MVTIISRGAIWFPLPPQHPLELNVPESSVRPPLWLPVVAASKEKRGIRGGRSPDFAGKLRHPLNFY